jgi:hypothetical protein
MLPLNMKILGIATQAIVLAARRGAQAKPRKKLSVFTSGHSL